MRKVSKIHCSIWRLIADQSAKFSFHLCLHCQSARLSSWISHFGFVWYKNYTQAHAHRHTQNCYSFALSFFFSYFVSFFFKSILDHSLCGCFLIDPFCLICWKGSLAVSLLHFDRGLLLFKWGFNGCITHKDITLVKWDQDWSGFPPCIRMHKMRNGWINGINQRWIRRKKVSITKKVTFFFQV